MPIRRINLAATPIRRPLVFATLIFLLLGHLLPGGQQWQMMRILDTAGNPQRIFALRTDDPRLGVIESNIIKAHSKYPELSTHYVTTKWEMEVAEVYARDPRSKLPEPTSTNVKLASFVPSLKDNSPKDNSQPIASPANPLATDWAEYWRALQTDSSAKLDSLSIQSKESNIFQRLELMETTTGNRPVLIFAVQLFLAVAGFLIVSRWLPPTTVRRLELRVPFSIEVPSAWIGRPLLSRISLRRFTRAQVLEIVAASGCLILV